MLYDKINEKYGVPEEDVSCPGCGQIYGHHNTKVCKRCEECSSCCKRRSNPCLSDKSDSKHYFIHAQDFIHKWIGI